MSRGVPRPNKTCLACGETMLSVQYTDSIKTWGARKFCSQTCRTDFNAKRIPSRFPARSPLNSADALATRDLLKRLLRYGLRHDGLPGLAANDLIRLAQEHGVAA